MTTYGPDRGCKVSAGHLCRLLINPWWGSHFFFFYIHVFIPLLLLGFLFGLICYIQAKYIFEYFPELHGIYWPGSSTYCTVLAELIRLLFQVSAVRRCEDVFRNKPLFGSSRILDELLKMGFSFFPSLNACLARSLCCAT